MRTIRTGAIAGALALLLAPAATAQTLGTDIADTCTALEGYSLVLPDPVPGYGDILAVDAETCEVKWYIAHCETLAAAESVIYRGAGATFDAEDQVLAARQDWIMNGAPASTEALMSAVAGLVQDTVTSTASATWCAEAAEANGW